MKVSFTKFIFFPVLLLSLSLRAQSFEGKITYAIRIESKLPSVTDEQFTQMLGNRQEYYVKRNQYKTIANGAVLQWQVYLPGENRLYNKMSNSQTLYWNDGAENKDSILSEEITPNADTLLGYPCSKLVLHCLGGTQTFWFNKMAAPVQASLYIRHKLANWYEVLRRTGALPLQYLLSNPQFTLMGTAVSVTPMKIDNAIFTLPAGAQTAQNPN